MKKDSKYESFARTTHAIMAGLLFLAVCGCTSGSGSGSGSPPKTGTGSAANYVYLSGNWQVQVTPATGSPAVFTGLGGFINEQGQNPGVDDLTTAAFQATQPSSCFTDATTIPLQGATLGADIRLSSFTIDGQVISLTATKNSTANQFTGNYSIKGGCADGASGTISGTEYADVNGTYSGTLSTGQTLTITLTQYTQGTGDGVFLISGSGQFPGFSCFGTGSLSAQNGGVAGSAIALTFDTDGQNNGQVVLTGTINSTATAITLTAAQVTGGNCPATLGLGTLSLQSS